MPQPRIIRFQIAQLYVLRHAPEERDDDHFVQRVADKIDLAMEPFAQVESDINRRYEGTGLGLPLAKRLVELHGGTLSLKSQVNSGTVVSIILPSDRVVDDPQVLFAVKAAG